jgi:predicted AAA+ superfamily ATPase
MIVLKRKLAKELMLSTKSYPIVTLTGPRQSGKTTLAKTSFPKKIYKNLELPDIRQFAKMDCRQVSEARATH